jgi:long-subunit acyl-CoA synthetase (AMP-forming)
VRKAGSVGKPVLHTDVTIRDRENNVLGPGQVGELCIRGGNVTSGYWNRPEATAKALIDGWLHSGDAAMVRRGRLLLRLWIAGRICTSPVARMSTRRRWRT